MGNFAINEFGEAVRTQNGTHKSGAPAPKKRNVADIMKAGRRQANAAKRTAAETQEFLKWALQNCKNQGDLDAIRDLIASNGTPKQRKAFAKMEYDLAKPARVQHRETQKMYNQLFGYGNGKHPSNTPLGTAQPTSSRGMTWAKYAEEHGKSYTKPFSDIGHANKLAEEVIARNAKHAEMQNVYEELFGEKPPVAEAPVEKPPVTESPIGNATNPSVDNGKLPVDNGNKPPVSNGGKPPVDNGGTKPPINNGGKTKGKGKGFKMPKFGKKGKFALAALALGALGAGIAYLTKSKKAAPTTPTGEPIKPGFIMTDSIKEEKVDTIPFTPVVNQVDTIKQEVIREIPQDAQSGKYIVKKGDNCWNIVKAEIIKEKGAETLSDSELDKEIIRRLPKFLKDNDLHYEKDKYRVLIYENDTLNIKM